MTDTLIIANIFSFFSACFTIASSWTKNPKRTYAYQVAQCLIYAVASYFFGVYPAIVMMLVNAFRNFLVAGSRYSVRWMAACSVMSLAVGLRVSDGSVAGYLSIIATVYYTIASFYLTEPRAVKINVAVDLSLWLAYDFLVKDVSSGIVDGVSVVLAIVTFIRITRQKPPEMYEKQNS